MPTIVTMPECRPPAPPRRRLRFAHIAITSVFGEPLNSRTWSGAPNNLAMALRRAGVAVEGIAPRIDRYQRYLFAGRHLARGFGRLANSEQILRSAPARQHHAARLATAVARIGVRDVLHTGTLDLPALDLLRGVRHYLYCDHTWALSLRHRPDADFHSARAIAEFEQMERDSLAGLEHIFTFGDYVRDNIIDHYGIAPDRVTAVGSGMGPIEPYFGAKDYARPRLLFVAKHLFKAKGGELLAAAFALAHSRRNDLQLTIVGDRRSRALIPNHPNITLCDHLPWDQLQGLYRASTLLVQPMLNDPWGQVYLEALASRTAVLGLARNGLPEIVEGGRHGFLLDRAEPPALANAILDALSDPVRLGDMAASGQRRVLESYSWDRVAERVAFT